MAWIWNNGKACYDPVDTNYALAQAGILTPGKLYRVDFTITGRTQGKVMLNSFSQNLEYSADGTYSVFGIAIMTDLVFVGGDAVENVFDGCLDEIQVREVPFYVIKDSEGSTVFEQEDSTGVTASGDNVQYQISWSDLDEGCYTIEIGDFVSDCISLKQDHGCTLVLTWSNNENAFGFNYSDLEFIQRLRVNGKKWQPNYSKEKTVFKDNAGNRLIIKSEVSKEESLTINEVPEYIHDAISIGLEHDNFYVNGVKYTNEEGEYSPKWRKSSQLAPVEVIIIKDQNLKNSNC